MVMGATAALGSEAELDSPQASVEKINSAMTA